MWWLCEVSICLGWTTFPRIPFLVCSWLGWAREVIGRLGRSKGSSSNSSRWICTLPSLGSSFNFLTPRCVFSSYNWGLLQDTCYQCQRQQEQKFQSLLVDFQFGIVSCSLLHDSLPDCLPWASSSDIRQGRRWQPYKSLLYRLPQLDKPFPESPDRPTVLNFSQWWQLQCNGGKDSFFNKQNWSIGNPYGKKNFNSSYNT